jgi:hypothetical protein
MTFIIEWALLAFSVFFGFLFAALQFRLHRQVANITQQNACS